MPMLLKATLLSDSNLRVHAKDLLCIGAEGSAWEWPSLTICLLGVDSNTTNRPSLKKMEPSRILECGKNRSSAGQKILATPTPKHNTIMCDNCVVLYVGAGIAKISNYILARGGDSALNSTLPAWILGRQQGHTSMIEMVLKTQDVFT